MSIKYYDKLKAIVLTTNDPLGRARVQVWIPSIHGPLEYIKIYRGGSTGSDGNLYPWAKTTMESALERKQEIINISGSTDTGGGFSTSFETHIHDPNNRSPKICNWLYGQQDGNGKFDVIWVSFEGGNVSFPVFEDIVVTVPGNRINLIECDLDNRPISNSRRATVGSIDVGWWSVGEDLNLSDTSSYSVSNSLKGGRLEEIAGEVVYGGKSYHYVGNTDTGALNEHICAGKLNFIGNNVRNLLKSIEAYDPSAIESEILTNNLDKDWSTMEASEGSSFTNSIISALSTSASRDVQDSLICNKMNGYINVARKKGITYPPAIVYFCDLASSNYDEAIQIARQTYSMCVRNVHADMLVTMHNITIGGGYVLGSTIDDNYIKRKETYDTINDLIASGAFKQANEEVSVDKEVFLILYPVDPKYSITREFGYSIRHDVNNNIEYILHKESDITGADLYMKPVLSGMRSIVKAVGYSNESGNYIELEGIHTRIYNLLSIESYIEVGNVISTGTLIGYNRSSDKVIASYNAKVTNVNYSAGLYTIDFEDSTQLYTIKYSHLATVSVQEGDVLNPGDSIGTVGRSGDTTGVCLSISIYDNVLEKYIDPKYHFYIDGRFYDN